MEQREGYIKTKIGWIPEDWDSVKISELSKIIRGASPRPKGDPRYYGGNVPRLMGADVTRDGKLVIPKIDFLTEEGAKKSRFLKKGSLTLTCSGTVGIPSILGVDACVHDGFIALTDISEKYEIDFLFYIFKSLQNRFNRSATHGGVFTNLTTQTIKDFLISSPPFPEQKKIASILTTVDDKISSIDQQIQQTEQLKKGLMEKLLTEGIGHTEFKDTKIGRIPAIWDVKKIGSIVTKIVGGGTPSRERDDFYIGEIPWITVKDLAIHSFYKTTSIEMISEEGLKSSASNLIEKGNIIIATRMGLGRGFINSVVMAINQDMKALYFNYEFISNSYFLHWYFSKTLFIEQLGSGTTVKGITLNTLKTIQLPIPPLSEQKQIATILSTVDDKIDILQEKKTTYITLKKGLMQQLLTGQMRVKL